MSLILSSILLSSSPSPQVGPRPEAWTPRSGFGWSSCWVGDVDGDGRVDLAASDHTYANQVNKHAFRSWLESENQRRSGAVYLFSGSDGAPLATIDDPAQIRGMAQGVNGGCVNDVFGEGLAFVAGRDGQKAVLLVADHTFPGAVHGFEIPEARHRWSVEGDAPEGLGGDAHFGYRVYSDAAESAEPLFVVGTANPWAGEDPRIRVLHAIDGVERLRIHSSGILPHIE